MSRAPSLRPIFTAVAGLLLVACNGVVSPVFEGNAEADDPLADAGISADDSADAGVDADDDAGFEPDAGDATDGGEPDDVEDAGTGAMDAGAPDAGLDPCLSSKLCETFESYSPATLTNNALLGPWRVVVVDSSGSASIDTSRAHSGGRSLKIHIDSGAKSGAQLRLKGDTLFSQVRPQLHGRFMLWRQAAAWSTHWTLTGASGINAANSPLAGHRTTYMVSDNGSDRFMAVFYDSATKQDCWNASQQKLPVSPTTGKWSCVTFMLDGPGMKLRLALDGQSIDSFSVDTTGDGCLSPFAADTPWYGPKFDEFYIGARSFHSMSGPLDIWIDDIIVDTVPVACPAD